LSGLELVQVDQQGCPDPFSVILAVDPLSGRMGPVVTEHGLELVLEPRQGGVPGPDPFCFGLVCPCSPPVLGPDLGDVAIEG